jgi:hypothetical protein
VFVSPGAMRFVSTRSGNACPWYRPHTAARRCPMCRTDCRRRRWDARRRCRTGSPGHWPAPSPPAAGDGARGFQGHPYSHTRR